MKWLVMALLMVPLGAAQPDLGSILAPVDEVLGEGLPPVIATAYDTLGHNLSREDIRLYMDLDVTKASVGIFGLLLGSGKAELEASTQLRAEMRVISSERIRALLEGDNPYKVDANNATLMSEMFIPAEVFRTTLSATIIAAFQEEQEAALSAYLEATVPELELVNLDIAWSNVHPFDSVRDGSLTEPPIVLEMDATFRYLRVESIPSLVSHYLDKAGQPENPKKAYIKEVKQENSDPLQARDFYAAAAFSQLLNLSMQPGWSLDVDISLPRGYSLEYANQAIEVHDKRHASFSVGGRSENEEADEVLIISLTHRKAVTVAIFVGMLVCVGFLNALSRWPYAHFRLSRHRKQADRTLAATAS